MHKVIVYGVCAIEMRRQIEHFLDDEYEIIGYSDTYLSEDLVDEKRFISIEKIQDTDYNYVLLAITSEIDWTIQLLGQYNVPADKIVYPDILRWSSGGKLQRNIIHEIDSYTDDYIEALIFGLSYSRRGILHKRLGISCFNYSCPGLDLYYNFMLYKYTKENKPELLRHIRYAFWVMPYYYFDYDMSIALSQYTSGQICNMTQLDDWHNAYKTPQTNNYIITFRMFARNILNFYNSPSIQVVRKIWDGEDRGFLLGSWNKCYQETRDENISLLREAIDDLKNIGCKSIILNPPMYVEGMNSVSKEIFFDKQEFFSDVCRTHFKDAEVWDYSEEYRDRKELFDTLDHLNIYGAQEFTEKLSKRIAEMHLVRSKGE